MTASPSPRSSTPRIWVWSAAGEGLDLLHSGATSFGGDLPVNLSGGLQACGHPVGATGVRMVAEIFDQVTNEAGARQVKGAPSEAWHTRSAVRA